MKNDLREANGTLLEELAEALPKLLREAYSNS